MPPEPQSTVAATRTDLTEVTVVGADRTGIVAGITGLLFEYGANIEDVEQTVRDGVFRMTLHADCGFERSENPERASGNAASRAADRSENAGDPLDDREGFRTALVDEGDEMGVDVRVRFPDERDEGIAVLVTKEDHCLRALCETDLAADVRVVVGNHPDLEPVAAEYDVPFYDVGDGAGVPDEERLLALLDEYDVDLVVLARYMRILSPEVVFRYPGRIVNVHPSLLPAFPGAQAYRQAVEEGVRVAGVTAHYVTTDLDQGPVLTQRAFDVSPDATVADVKSRGRPLEADALVEAVRIHLAGDATVRRGRVDVSGDHRFSGVADGATPGRPVDAGSAED